MWLVVVPVDAAFKVDIIFVVAVVKLAIVVGVITKD
jgi:hypothetical protein